MNNLLLGLCLITTTLLLPPPIVVSAQSSQVAQALETRKIKADRLFNQGVEYFNQGQFTQALRSWEAALGIYQQIENETQAEVKTLRKLGDAYFQLNQYESAFSFHQRYLHLLQQLEGKEAQAKVLARLGDNYRGRKQYERALFFHNQFLSVTQELGNPQPTANALSRVGYTYFLAQQYRHALELYQKSLVLREELDDIQGQAQVLYWLSISYFQQGENDSALRFHQRSLNLYQILVAQAKNQDILRSLAGDLLELGNDYLLLTGEPQPAIDFYQRSLDIFQRLGDKEKEASILLSLGNLALKMQQYEQALELHQQFLRLNQDLGKKVDSELLIIRQAYIYQGQYEGALKLYQNYLAWIQQSGEPAEVAEVMFSIGELYSEVEKYESAIDFYEQSLATFQQSDLSKKQLSPLRKLGDTYLQLREYDLAISFYDKFLAITEQVYGRKSAADFQGRYLGRVFTQAQRYKKAIEFRQQAIATFRELNEREDEAINLKWLGDTYRKVNQYQEAESVYQESLAIFRDLGNQDWEIIVLESLGKLFLEAEQYTSALEFYQQLITKLQEIGNQGEEASTLESLGDALLERQQYELATELYQQYLALIQASGDSIQQVTALNQIGQKYQENQRYESALLYYQQALSISYELQQKTEFSDFDLAGVTLGNIGVFFAAQEQPELAIIFYKAAINNYEQIRAQYTASELVSTSDFASLFLSKHEADYRNLADLLLQQNRILEAQRVLDLLKVQELDNYLNNVRATEDSEKGISERNSERLILQGSQSIFNQEILHSQELTKLEAIPLSQRSTAQKQRIYELRQAQQQLIKQFNHFLHSPQVKASLTQLQQNTGTETLNFEQAKILSDNLARLGKDTVILYPLILEERLELILLTPHTPPLRRTVSVGKKQLNETIIKARRSLTNKVRRDFTALNQLYQWLIEPIEQDLAQAQTKTIIYAPDSQLRYIPLAALYDGNQWLTQRFQINHITALSLTELSTTSSKNLRILAAAWTQGKQNLTIGEQEFSFAGLPFAGVEVNNLAAMIPNTSKRLDQQFSKNLIHEMQNYAIIHLATHAHFVTGEPKDSFIMFGNGEYVTLREVEKWNLNNVDLVVLSACETGVGDILGNGEEILGFGFQMQRAGAKAAIASLWAVDDGGTQELMHRFYSSLQQNNMSKVAALQQAQNNLITTSEWSHPYYWASFFLIGNGL